MQYWNGLDIIENVRFLKQHDKYILMGIYKIDIFIN